MEVVAAIASFVTLAREAYKVCKPYADRAKDARSTVRILTHELQALKRILSQIDDLASEPDAEASQAPSTRAVLRNFHSDEYRAGLNELFTGLAKFPRKKRRDIVLQSMRWPFSEAQTQEKIDALHRHVGLLQQALSIDTFTVSSTTLRDIRGLRGTWLDSEHRNVLEWLSPIEPRQKLDDLLSRHQKGTGQWFLEHENFQQWVKADSTGSLLWCPGDPGAGKTIMSSLVVDHLERQHGGESIGVAFLFCDYNSRDQQSATSLLETLAKQLSRTTREAMKKLTELHNRCRANGGRPSLADLESLIIEICTNLKTSYVILDALDECDVNNGRRDLIPVLQRMARTSIKLLVTSRPNPSDIQSSLETACRIDIVAKDSDVRLYVEHSLFVEEKSLLAGRVQNSDQLKRRVIDEVTKRASGMFLMAVLLLNRVREQRTERKILDSLEVWSNEPEDVYRDTMNRIRGQRPNDAALGMRILQWLTHVKRPLLVYELLHALAVEWDGKGGPPRQFDHDNILDPQSMLDVCAGLVTIEQETQIIRLVHYTTKEYLVRDDNLLLQDAEAEIARTCLLYLSLDDWLWDRERDPSLLPDGSSKTHPAPILCEGRCTSSCIWHPRFLPYAFLYWGTHAKEQNDEQLLSLTFRFLNMNRHIVNVECGACPPVPIDQNQGFALARGHSSLALHTLARFGMAKELKTLLCSEEILINFKDNNNDTALHVAAGYGNEAVAELLLGTGQMDVNARGQGLGVPLHVAAVKGYEGVVRVLLTQGNIDVNARVRSRHTALSLAFDNGHEPVVWALLSRADLELTQTDLDENTALHRAANLGFLAVAKYLLACDRVDPNQMNRWGHTALLMAVDRRREAIVRALLASDKIDINRGLRHPLMNAVLGSSLAVVKLILQQKNIRVDLSWGEMAETNETSSGNEARSRDCAEAGQVIYLAKAGSEYTHDFHPNTNAMARWLVSEYLSNVSPQMTCQFCGRRVIHLWKPEGTCIDDVEDDPSNCTSPQSSSSEATASSDSSRCHFFVP
ncbi:MAG: hypothetical protein M1817_002187 [Caeruleum heppii]|nr:MAG: hypothetical protein M1817_002187 [Caeruleum heppii]